MKRLEAEANKIWENRFAVHASDVFYFIAIEYLSPLDATVQRWYQPVEVGVLEYSLRRGITNKFHHFINPGPPPEGYSFSARQHQQNFHHIDFDLDVFQGFVRDRPLFRSQ